MMGMIRRNYACPFVTVRTKHHLNIVVLTPWILTPCFLLQKRQFFTVKTFINSLQKIRTVSLCAEHRVRRFQKRVVVTEEAFYNIFSVAGAVSVYAEWSAVIGYDTHLVTYGADSSFLFVEATIRIETVRKFDGEREGSAEAANSEGASTRAGWIRAVSPDLRNLF